MRIWKQMIKKEMQACRKKHWRLRYNLVIRKIKNKKVNKNLRQKVINRRHWRPCLMDWIFSKIKSSLRSRKRKSSPIYLKLKINWWINSVKCSFWRMSVKCECLKEITGSGIFFIRKIIVNRDGIWSWRGFLYSLAPALHYTFRLMSRMERWTRGSTSTSLSMSSLV